MMHSSDNHPVDAQTSAPQNDADVTDEMLAAMYQELRELARHRLDRESGDDLPQPTSMVHEVYLKLLSGKDGVEPKWDSHGHLFAAAAEAMRRILVDRARKRKAARHGGGRLRVHLTSIVGAEEPRDAVDMERLDAALDRLANIDQRMMQIVNLRFFAGLTIAQTAQAINVSEKTVERDWVRARAWLISELEAPQRPGG